MTELELPIKFGQNRFPTGLQMSKLFALFVQLFTIVQLIILIGCTPNIYNSEENVTVPVKSKTGKVKYFPIHSKWIGFEDDFEVDFKQLSQFSKLESLEITCPCIRDLDPLPDLPHLKYLNIAGTKIKSLKPLQKLKSIDVLHLSGTEIESLQEISNLKKMIWLRLDKTKIKDLQFVKLFPELRRLDVRYTNVSDLSPISSAKKLNELRISHTQINSLEKIKGLTQLVYVEIENLNIPEEQVMELKLINPYIKIIKKNL